MLAHFPDGEVSGTMGVSADGARALTIRTWRERDLGMCNLTEENLTAAVLGQLTNAADPRLGRIMASLIRHLHAFLREVELSEAEWRAAIEFLTEVGKHEEFVLLSDTLGASSLVVALNHRAAPGVTESSILGPFYREGAPLLTPPARLDRAPGGKPVIVSGRVTRPDGAPIAGALLDVWQTAPNGLYENQDPDQPDYNLRGRLLTDREGRYEFRTALPVSYPIPTGGPVGRMLRALGRHPLRPAHIHFRVSAPGYEPLTTMLFVEGDPYLDSDPVFAVKTSLVVPFERRDAPEPLYTARYDFRLQPAAARGDPSAPGGNPVQ